MNKPLIRTLTIILFFSFSCLLTYAQPSDNKKLAADDAYSRKDYKLAFKIYKELAEAGSTIAMEALAKMYVDGDGTEENKKLGLDWLIKSAEAGDRQAQNTLSTWYGEGNIIPKDSVKQKYWYDKANGVSIATSNSTDYIIYNKALKLYDENRFGEAINLIIPLAKKEYPPAMSLISTIYKTGSGVQKNYEQAIVWGEKAANAGNKIAKYNLGILFTLKDNRFRDPVKAVYWFNQAIIDGDMDAGHALSQIYRSGDKNVPGDKFKADEFLIKAAEGGSATAQVQLGIAFLSGENGRINDNLFMRPKNRDLGILWIKKAAAQGNENAKAIANLDFPPEKEMDAAYSRAVAKADSDRDRRECAGMLKIVKNISETNLSIGRDIDYGVKGLLSSIERYRCYRFSQ